ncbi:MAG: fibronectin type III domain-containing protein [Oscillospiraceae bacterium]|nr:fibronectin type III domain-containing protein [Oscillospiraceae bacterium]
MLDFNTKRNILRKLRIRSESHWYWRLPCAVAMLFVKLWYAVGCTLGMALSDRQGNLLGIKGLGEKEKIRRQDDIVYVKKPFIGRILSAVLAVSFTFMLLPDLGIDLGLGITVSALESFTFEGIRYYQNPDSEFLYFKQDEHDEAIKYSVTDITVEKTAFGSMVVSWKFSGASVDLVSGFQVYIYNDSNNSSVENGNGSGEFISSASIGSDGVVRHTFTGLSTTGDLRIRIIPITYLMQYKYTPAYSYRDEETGKEIEIPATLTVYSGNDQSKMYLVQGVSNQTTKAINLNAKFDAPTVVVNNNVEDCYDPKVEITWNHVRQKGGTDDGAYPYAYILYRSEDGGSFKQLGDIILFEDPDEAPSFTDKTIVAGRHYQYFVEAFRYAWKEEAGFNPNHEAIISSSGTIVGSSADNKAASGTYSSKIRDLYVAPAKPSMTVEPGSDNNSYYISIDTKPGGVKTNYSGVYIFRTEGPVPLSANDIKELVDDPDGIYNGNFGKWLVNNCMAGNATYNVSYVTAMSVSGNSTTLSYLDKKNIVAGVTYWYYAVAYLDKGNDILYGKEVDRQTTVIDLYLKTPLSLVPENGDGHVNLTWEGVSNAQGYEIAIRKISSRDYSNEGLPETEYDIIDLGKNLKYLHDFLYNGDTYEYKVRAYIDMKQQTANGEQPRVYSEWTKPRTVTVGLPFEAPQNVSATTVDGQVTVKWDKTEGATSYQLFYTNLTTGESGSFGGLTKETYTHTNLINGHRYTYYVVAYKDITGDGTYGVQHDPSEPSNSITIKVGQDLGIPQDLAATTKDGEIKVSWADVEGAEGYILEYRIKGTSRWTQIDLSRTEFNHTRLNNGDVYEYRVKAYKTVSGERVYSEYSIIISMKVGDTLDAPKDFKVVTTDGTAILTWTKVEGAEGYVVYAYSGGRAYEFDVSKETFEHSSLANGDSWTYYVRAYKTVNGERFYSSPTKSITVTIGVSLNAAVDLVATAGNHQIDLTWTAVDGAEGYVVYLYNNKTMEFEPIAVTSGTVYSHVGLKNGQKYTYMVASFKTVNGERTYGVYSMAVSAVPTTGSTTDVDRTLNVKGTSPYGISHSEYISAKANHDAFDETVDVYFTTNTESTDAVKDVLKHYANGLSSFVVYPFDISIYQEGTLIEVNPADGYTVTITMPVPDILIPYRDYMTVIHVSGEDEEEETEEIAEPAWYEVGDQRMEVLPCAIIEIDNIWCIQFKCSSFSPYAFVIYKDHIQDVSSGDGIFDGSLVGSFNTGGLLLFTALPDIMPHNKKLRVVRGKSKRYRIKNVEKK